MSNLKYLAWKPIATIGQLWNRGSNPVDQLVCECSLIPRPPPFYVLRFAFSIIHGSGRAWGRPGNKANVSVCVCVCV